MARLLRAPKAPSIASFARFSRGAIRRDPCCRDAAAWGGAARHDQVGSRRDHAASARAAPRLKRNRLSLRKHFRRSPHQPIDVGPECRRRRSLGRAVLRQTHSAKERFAGGSRRAPCLNPPANPPTTWVVDRRRPSIRRPRHRDRLPRTDDGGPSRECAELKPMGSIRLESVGVCISLDTRPRSRPWVPMSWFSARRCPSILHLI